jgi:hypothetical protein
MQFKPFHLGGLLVVGLVMTIGCRPRDFNDTRVSSVGGQGDQFAETLLSYHRSMMSQSDVSQLSAPDFYVFNRGCAVGMPSEEVARRTIDGARDPSYGPAPDAHIDTCQQAYIDPATFDMRAIVRRQFNSTAGSNTPGTPRAVGQSSIVDVLQVPPNTKTRKRCYNSLPSARAIYRVYAGRPYYEVQSRGVTVGVITEIQTVVNQGLDKSTSNQVDLDNGFYPRVYLMPGLCGVSAPYTTCQGKGSKGCGGGIGLPPQLPVPPTPLPGAGGPGSQTGGNSGGGLPPPSCGAYGQGSQSQPGGSQGNCQPTQPSRPTQPVQPSVPPADPGATQPGYQTPQQIPRRG